MAEQIECVGGPKEGTPIECTGGGPADGRIYCYRDSGITICSINNVWNTETCTMEIVGYWSHIYHYNHQSNTYEYKGVRK